MPVRLFGRHPLEKGASVGGTMPSRASLLAQRLRYSVLFDGTTEEASNMAASAKSPDQHASGAVAVWVKGTDTVGTIFNWRNGAGSNQILLLPGAGGACRMFVQMNGSTKVDTTGSTVITDGAWHLIGFSWTWATGCQLYVDGVAEGALDACTDAWPATPAMTDILLAKNTWAGKIARGAVFSAVKDAAWWAAAHADPQQSWWDAAHDWRMGDTSSDRPALVTIADVRGGLDLTTTGMDATNLIADYPV